MFIRVTKLYPPLSNNIFLTCTHLLFTHTIIRVALVLRCMITTFFALSLFTHISTHCNRLFYMTLNIRIVVTSESGICLQTGFYEGILYAFQPPPNLSPKHFPNTIQASFTSLVNDRSWTLVKNAIHCCASPERAEKDLGCDSGSDLCKGDGSLWFWSVIKTIMTDCSRVVQVGSAERDNLLYYTWEKKERDNLLYYTSKNKCGLEWWKIWS